jgi:amino acid transporter
MSATDVTLHAPQAQSDIGRSARGGVLARTAGGIEVLAQSVAAAAPSVALASVPGTIFLVAGQGTLLSILIGAVVVILVAYTISLQARRTVSSGSLATFTGNGFGPGASFATAWGLLIGYALFAVGALLGAWLYASSLLDKLGISSSSEVVGAILVLIAISAALASAYRGIRLSARLGLALELTSLTLIGIVLIASLVTHGFRLDTAQFTAKGASSTDVVLGAVLAVDAFAGFESAASLGLEARNAHRTIARVLIRVVFGLAVLYLFASYTEILGFGKLTGSSAPLHVVADYAGVSWASYVVDLGVSVAMVAFAAAVLNAAARSLYTLGREGALPARFASVHPRFGSPHVGVVVIGVVATAVSLVFVFTGTGALTASIYTGTIASFGFFTAYILVSLATPVWLWKRKELTAVPVITGVTAAAAMLYVVYKNIVPAPPSPYNLLPWIYLGLLLLGLAFYTALRLRSPERAREIGSIQVAAEEELHDSDRGPLHVGASV